MAIDSAIKGVDLAIVAIDNRPRTVDVAIVAIYNRLGTMDMAIVAIDHGTWASYHYVVVVDGRHFHSCQTNKRSQEDEWKKMIEML